MPRGILAGMFTLIVFAFLILWLNPSVVGVGSHALGKSGEPLLDGFRAIYGESVAKLLSLVAVVGLVASFHTIIFAYGRQIYSLSRAGYFPRWLSLTHGKRHTPHAALVTGAALGYAAALAIHGLGPSHPVGAVLLNMAVFGAVISYALQMLSFVLLRRRLPHRTRPFRSPLGIPGALVALAISATTFVALFVSDPVYRRVAVGAAVWYALGLAWFALVGRHRLVLSPEERFAAEETGRR
jgi:ethanolamine permease